MVLTTKEVFDEIDVLPPCLAELVAHYARSNDKDLIVKALLYRSLNQEKLIHSRDVTIELPTFCIRMCFPVNNPFYYSSYFYLGYNSFFEDFRDFLETQKENPKALEMLNEVYDSTLAMFSSFTTLTK